MNESLAARRGTYAGLFLVALSTLMYEILLTRIFSVTIWYHLAFFAISVAMFGMTVGAILVYLLPGFFTEERAPGQLALASLLFSLAVVMSFLTHLSIPILMSVSLLTLYSVAFTYAVIAVPFVFSGIAVCLALTRFPRHVSRLYAADLAGAALGCVLLICLLKLTDGPTAVFAVAALAALGALCFAASAGSWKTFAAALGCGLLLAAFAAGNTVLVYRQRPLVRLVWVKGARELPPLYEKWNSFSRIQVSGNPAVPSVPAGVSFSPAYPLTEGVGQANLSIDACASTVLTKFNDDLKTLEYLKYDLVNFVHYLRPGSRVLVVGVGGGRDVLSALVFGQKSVVGVEINEEIIKTVNGRFGDFTGRLDRRPGVTFINDEARSFIARQTDRFDIIQTSFIDTWAATAAGAFVLAESPLYTVEAWKTFLDHLTPNGIVTFSRWYFRERPGEIYRLTSLAATALLQLGVTDPRGHVVIVRCMPAHRPDTEYQPDGVGTILVSRSPFSEQDLATIEDVARRLQFEVALSPRAALDDTFAQIASGRNLAELVARYPLNIGAPTDDSPFFFHMLRVRDVFERGLWQQGTVTFNMKAVFILASLLLTVIFLTLLCIVVPLLLTSRTELLWGAMPLFVYFAGIGFGFMLIEISQLQRLIVFLGHPTYGLAVVLFSLLLSSGLGSFLTGGVRGGNARASGLARLALLLGVLIAFGVVTPHAVQRFHGAETALRIAIAVAILFPLGLFMGMMFPIGMKVASARAAALTPWLWGINGATSVCASVLAVVIALGSGISTTFWSGFACYVAAALAFLLASREGA